MSGVNKVILIGNLGGDPEVRTLDSGAKVAKFTLATSETWKDKNTGEKKTETEWHNVVLWKGLAEIAEKYLKKGSKVYVEGRLKSRSWEDSEGVKRYAIDISGTNLTMLSKAETSDQPEQNNQQEESDDLPF